MNYNTTILNRQEISETREMAFYIANQMSDRQLFTHMGILNSLVWRTAVDYEAIEKINGVDKIIDSNWKNLLGCCAQGEVKITLALEWQEWYLKAFWKGAFHTAHTLIKYRKQHISWGLFYFDVENRPRGAKWGYDADIPGHGIATPPVLERVDVARMLIFYQIFDQVRRERINEKLKHSDDVTSFDCMPKHGGMLMVELYDALFFGGCDFRGNHYGFADIQVNVDATPVFKQIEWRWRRRKGLFRSLWERMVQRAGFVAQEAKKIVIEMTQPLDMATVPY